MKKILQLLILFFYTITWSQQDFSNYWEDFFSYNNVKDFVKTGNQLTAIVDNALFIYNTNTKQYQKLSTVQGLSGQTTSSLYVNQSNNTIIVGYENGLLEIIDKDFNITVATNIRDFNFIGSKAINAITSYNNKLYLATSFAIIEYDLENLEFGDTFFIGNQSSEIKINQIEIFNNKIYAATENGIFYAEVNNNNLVDFNEWTQIGSGNYPKIKQFNNQLFIAQNRNLYQLINGQLSLVKSYPSTIVNLSASSTNFTITTARSIYVNNKSNTQVYTYTSTSSSSTYFTAQKSYVEEGTIFIATKEFGILKSTVNTIENFTKIHPEGPFSNSVFSINAKDNHLWMVYGGYGSAYAPNRRRSGVTHFNNGSWTNIPYNNINVYGLVNVTFHPENTDKVYISSWGAGMVIMENNEVKTHWTHLNSGLESLTLTSNPNYVSIRINGSNFDENGNLWIANAWVNNKIKKYTPSGEWYSVDMSSVFTNPALGLNELKIDKTNTVFVGSRRNGLLAYNENGNKKRALTAEFSNGSLPDLNVRTIQPDNNDVLWIGTLKGLVVLYNASQIFEGNVNTEPVLITE
ncbi:MAG TPA: two-component regulator propeller domain-containing protein, partial [Flavobacteriaceae bacterium]|nr:two-component regulator propeller domain-containing protein [Flavobacteriaceae bacterium]